jgi:serine/threonine protein kinase
MGSIYCATDTALGRLVAIKLLDDRFAGDPLVMKRFTREAFAAARLSSDPNTITIFDVGECDGRPFIVMEYLPGGSVATVLQQEGAQPVARALEWLGQAAAALDHAHHHQVVHRDVKPSNLLLTEDDRVLVADFGVASAAGLDSFTQTGTIIGSAGYLSPEQAEGRTATPASDRYGLAVVAFELLGGSRPFERSAPTAEASAHVHAPVPSLSERHPGIPPSVDPVFERALAKIPAQRPSSCAELVAALHTAFANAAEPTRILAPPSRPPDEPDQATGRTRAESVQANRRRLRNLLFLLTSLILLAAGAVAAVLGATDRGNSTAGGTDQITVTEQSKTVVRTVTQPAPTAPSATIGPSSTPSRPASGSSIALQGYARMKAGDYAGAIPLLEEAARALQGSGSLDEAYNDYNLALSLQRTQGCSSRVMQLLDASEAIQGHRTPIDELRRVCTNGR